MAFKTDRATVLEFAASLQHLRPDVEAATLWLNTMASGDYKFGYGLLRSGDDEYDPFGILVALNGGDWTWDSVDEAWAYKANAVALNSHVFAKWLGMRVEDVEMLEHLLDSLTRLTDQSQSFEPIVETFREAMLKAEGDRARLNSASYASVDHRGPDSPITPRTRVNYDRSAFYAL